MSVIEKKIKIHFYATADIAIATLHFLIQSPQVKIEKVITAPAKPQGRGQEVKDPEIARIAKNFNLPLLQTDNINLETDYVEYYSKEEHRPDLFIVFAFGQFLKEKLLQIPQMGPFNIHASLLPKWRGAAPIQWSLLKGDIQTGITIQRMVKKMDAGDIALQHPMEIAPNDNSETLFKKIEEQSPFTLNDFLQKIVKDEIFYQPQNENDATFAPTFKKEDAHVNFCKITRQELKNRLKAFYPWPGNFCFINKKRLKIFDIVDSPEYHKIKSGEVRTEMGQLIVGCLDGAVRLSKVQLEGKKVTSDADLLNGIRDSIIIS